MLTIVAIMFGGMSVGWLLRRRSLPWLSALIMVLIWLLLFFLGVEVGANDTIISSLKDLGGEALLLAFAGLAGSVLFAWVLWRVVQGQKGGSHP